MGRGVERRWNGIGTEIGLRERKLKKTMENRKKKTEGGKIRRRKEAGKGVAGRLNGMGEGVGGREKKLNGKLWTAERREQENE